MDRYGSTTSITAELATCLPNWNYDGSSTEPAEGLNSELILKPVAVYNDPFRQGQILVLCGTYDKDDNQLESNYRDKANEFFEYDRSQEPWFGIEQEYFVLGKGNEPMLQSNIEQGQYYCSVGVENALHRNVAEEHLLSCLRAGFILVVLMLRLLLVNGNIKLDLVKVLMPEMNYGFLAIYY